MEGISAELVRELRDLRKGRGLYARHISERVGPLLRQVCHLADDDGPAEIRRKVAASLEKLAHDLPADLRVAVIAAFAINPDAQLPFYQDRVRWVAEHLRRDERTARRRIDEGIDRIAELANSAIGSTPPSTEVPTAGWHTVTVWTAVVLDQSMAEAFEFRRIVAHRDNLTTIDLVPTLAASAEQEPADDSKLIVDVFFGGRLVDRARQSTDQPEFVLALPRQLNRDETHEFALRYRISDGYRRQRYVYVPKHRCELFELRIRFDADQLPVRVSRLTNETGADADDPAAEGEALPLDAAGEVHTVFQRLTPGKAYGARWAIDPTSDEPSAD
jgi:hypothetical protein